MPARMVRCGLLRVRCVQFVSVYRGKREKTEPDWMHEGLFFTDDGGIVDTEEDEKFGRGSKPISSRGEL